MSFNKVKKIALVGIDCLTASVVEKLVADGKLPTIALLMKEGSYASAMSHFPAVTGPSWATIATGATPQTHQSGSFDSTKLKAEQIWQVMAVLENHPRT